MSKVINIEAIMNWFNSLAYDVQCRICYDHFDHHNVDMLNHEDIVILYIKENGVNETI